MSLKHYGQTDSEKEAAEMFQCRQIVQEVINFGVNQKQLLRIIKLLALELENREVMEAVVQATKKLDEQASEQPKLIT